MIKGKDLKRELDVKTKKKYSSEKRGNKEGNLLGNATQAEGKYLRERGRGSGNGEIRN